MQKDNGLLKKIVLGMQSQRPGEVQTAILRIHLQELTESFMIPLERYMASLMPLQKNISPLKVYYVQAKLCRCEECINNLWHLILTGGSATKTF